MESTEVINTNHHFLTPSLDVQHDDREKQSTSSISGFRRIASEDCERSQSADFRSSAAFDKPSTDALTGHVSDGSSSTDALGRHLSISRSGRYKSKTKQRASLWSNGIDFSNATVVFFADDTITSRGPLDPNTVTSVDQRRQPVERKEISCQQVEAEPRKADASAVEKIDTACVKSSSEVNEESRKPLDESCVSVPSDTADICLEPAVAEMDESTDL